MPRANRHYIPGCVWHITHRCHKKEFLLKFARDRRRWLQSVFEAKKPYALTVLNYAVTSNHAVYEYSPWLAIIKAADWSEGEEKVVRKLHREINEE